MRFYSLGFEVLALNLIFIWGGYELSSRFSPESYWILFVGVFLAIVGTIFHLYNRLIKNK